MSLPDRTSPGLFVQHTRSRMNEDKVDDASDQFTSIEPSDLEKAETVDVHDNGFSTGAYRATSSRRISRVQSLQQRRAYFEHPLSHVKTGADVLVDFDGLDDPYRPINWPFRKKAITTLLYGLTTMGSTWSSSVYVAIRLFCV